MIKNIFFDFDGVILDSMDIRDYGFKTILSPYDRFNKMKDFIKYHRFNAGLSRFHKIRYFFKEYLDEEISDEKVNEMAEEFSKIMRKELIDKKYLIKQTVEFMEKNYLKYNFYIVSGSEQEELRYICKNLGIEIYFKEILGSPIHKNELVKMTVEKDKLNSEESILIGDSINDYEAAESNGLDFYGFNNEKLKEKSKYYIEDFKKIKFLD